MILVSTPALRAALDPAGPHRLDCGNHLRCIDRMEDNQLDWRLRYFAAGALLPGLYDELHRELRDAHW